MRPERSRLRRLGDSIPIQRSDWRLLGRTSVEVVGTPTYALVAVVSAAIAITAIVVARNFDAIRTFVVFGDYLSPVDRLLFLFDLYPFVGPAYPFELGVMLVGVSGLIGVNVAFLGYQLAELDLVGREGVGGAAGLIFGVLGSGCATCGVAILGGALSVAGVGSTMTLLPYDGVEFMGLSIVVLVVSVYALARNIAADTACPIDA